MARIAQVLLPLPLPEAFDYAEPDGMALDVGDLVGVPLGQRRVGGVVVALRDGAGHNRPLKPVLAKLDEPALPQGVLAFIAWAVIPFNHGWVISNLNVGILYLFAVSSLGVYGTVMAGWASNSKYAFLSALRAAAQMVSYEVSIGFVMITVLLFAGSLDISAIVHAQETAGWAGFLHWNVFSILFPMLVIFFVSSLAETQRPPFDLLEAESELVAGFFVEYSSTPFLLFFLGEYLSIVLMCAMCSILFLGGWLSPINVWPFNIPALGIFWFLLKICFFFFMFAMVKAMVPRYRYDQLMRLGWKIFLPTSLLWVILTAVWVTFIRPHL